MNRWHPQKALWIEDQPDDIAIIASAIKEKFRIDIDFALTLSSALRKMKKTSYDCLFVDNVIPLGSDSIATNEFKFISDGTVALGELLVTKIFSGELANSIRLEKLRGVIFSSALPTSERLSHLISEEAPRVLEWPKKILHSNQTQAISALMDFFDSAILWQQKAPKIENNDGTGVDERRSDINLENLASGPKQQASVDQIRMHVHELNQAITRAIATLEAVGVDLAALGGNGKEVDLRDFLKIKIGELDELMDLVLDSVTRNNTKIFDDLDERIKTLKYRLSDDSDLGKEHIKRLVMDIADRGSAIDPRLNNFFALLMRSIRANEASALVDQTTDAMHTLIEINYRFVQKLDRNFEEADSTSVNILSTLDAIISENVPRAERKRMFFRRFFPRNDINLFINDSDFRTIMNNLLDNAVKHSFLMPSSETWIDVHVEQDNSKSCKIQIINWGSEIRVSDQIYQYRARGNASLAIGSGQGLAVCKTICEKRRWRISHTSKPANSRKTNTVVQGRPAYMNAFTVLFRET